MQKKSSALAGILLPVIFFASFACTVSAFTEADPVPARLHFVNAIDANVYTERIVHEICNRLGIDVTVALEDMNIGLQGVNAGIYDGICNQTKGVEAEYDQLVPVPVETAICNFYALTLQQDTFECNAWDELSGKRVGSLSGKTFLTRALPEDIAAHIEQPGMTRLYSALRNGECDVLVVADTSDKGSDQLALPPDIRIAGVVDRHSCGIFLHRKHAALAARMVEVLEDMERDGSLARIKAMKPIENRGEKVVLYLSSFSAEMEWEQKLMEGVGNVLNPNRDVVFHNIALNSLRNTNPSLWETTALQSISVDFIHSPPDAVIVSDNEAMSFLMNNYNSILPNDIPVIACGVNSTALFTPQRFAQYPNIVGIEESISAARTVEEMLRLFPATERIFVINDHSLTGRRWKEEIRKQLGAFQGRVEIEYNEDLPFDALMTRVSGMDAHTLILCGSYFLDQDNHYYPQSVVQSQLYSASSVPIFGLLDSTQPYGPLGGRYADAVLYGERAATMVLDILQTGLPDEMPVTDMEPYSRWVFNWDIMQEYGIGRQQLPRDAILLNRKPTLQETDPVLYYGILVGAVAGAVIIVLLAVFSIVLRRRNHHLVLAEASIRKSHDEIEAVKNHLQTILETAPIAYSLLVDDVVVESNSYYDHNIGITPGRKNAEKYEDRGRHYAQLMEECRENGFVGNIHWYVAKRNGEIVRYLYNIARSEYEGQEAIVMWGVETEQLERQKDALNRAYRDLQEVIESAPMPIAMLYPEEKHFAQANLAWRKLFRIPDDVQISDLRWGTESILTTRPMHDLLRRARETGGTISSEWEFKTYDGEVFAARIFLSKVIFGGKSCLLVTHQDLRAERAREKMLQNAAEKEREANRLKSHFLMNMSHEIRTPMNAIIGITQLAKPTDEAEKLYGSILQIGHSTAVLLNIINEVLDLSMIEDGRMVLKPEEVQLSQLIADLDAVVAVDMGKKHIERSVDLQGVVHDTLRVDVSRLQQVIMALASNAVKFTPDGGEVMLTVRETEGPNHISTFLFAVRDSGIGIETRRMGRLFKPFEQGDDSITRQYGGAGLGLSVAKHIVELMGGKIWVESEVGNGSTFFFTIQAQVVSKDTEPAGAPADEIDFSKLRILLVDDVELNRMVAVELLSALGCTVEEAENGRQAVDMVAEAAPGYYDLVFMDVQMPVLDGCGATREIRALDKPGAGALPIVAMTANVMPDDIRMVTEAGMNGYVGKPVFLEQIIEAIQAQFGK